MLTFSIGMLVAIPEAKVLADNRQMRETFARAAKEVYSHSNATMDAKVWKLARCQSAGFNSCSVTPLRDMVATFWPWVLGLGWLRAKKTAALRDGGSMQLSCVVVPGLRLGDERKCHCTCA
jgi:hypothetical protein